MASQVAHIVYAGKYLEKYTISRPDEFCLGVCFPDIRRIEPSIRRSDTHIILSDLNADLRYLEPFQAGWKFHLFCDMRREEILNSFDFYSLPGTSSMWDLPNKLLEDELIYDSCVCWPDIVRLFDNPPSVTMPHFVSRETFEAWYAALAQYFRKKPDSFSMKTFILKMPKLVPYADEIVKSVEELRRNRKIREMLQRVKDEIISGI